MELNSKRVVVGISGGVDSSVALLLLKNQGYEPIGVSLKYDVWKDSKNACRENVCCTEESFAIAKKICRKLSVEHHIIDISKKFRCEVMDYFINEFKENRTPSPCVFCNLNVKFDSLIKFADKVGAKWVATGHYARVRAVESEKLKVKSYQLQKAKDKTKDQTYSLCFLNQKILSRVIFPLGDLTKEEVYEIAKKAGFKEFEKARQSQDFCFVSGKSLGVMLEKEVGIKRGKIVDESGKIYGEHKGLHFYTIGQRKGLGLALQGPEQSRTGGGPFYVVEKCKLTNVLVVSRDMKSGTKKEIAIFPVRFISGREPEKPIQVEAKLRSAQKPSKAVLCKGRNGDYLLKFNKAQLAVTSGQIAVFYKDQVCLGGGMIA